LSGNYCGYSDYLDSDVKWIGSVPAHWTALKFKRVISEKRHTSNSDLPAGSISFGRVVYKNSETLAEATKASYQEVLPDEFLVNPLNLNFDLKSLRTALSDIAVVVSTGYIVLRSGSRLDKRFTRWLLQEFDVAHMKTLGAGVRQTINFTDIGNSVFFAPSLEEQTQIAKFLDYETATIDALIEKQQQLIVLLKEKRQAVISHAVTKGLNPEAPMRDSGVEWLGEVPAHWGVVHLKRFISTRKGAPFKSTDFTDEGVQVVRASDIKNLGINSPSVFLPASFVESHSRAVLRAGELILSTVGSGPQVRNSAVGQIGRVPEELDGTLLNQNTVVFRVVDDRLLEDFLFHLVQVDGYRDHLDLHAHGTANQASLNVVDMLNFAVPVPPKSEQHEIVEFVARAGLRLDALENAAAAQVELLHERRTAIISAAVTGKIDVRGWKAPEAEAVVA
jgi:type I restriction enzyme S subunit